MINQVFFIIGIVSVMLLILHLLFLIGLAIYEKITNKINNTTIAYSLVKDSSIVSCGFDEFYLIPTICITKAYYLEIAIHWLCFTLSVGYRIKND